MTILDKIIEEKYKTVEHQKSLVPLKTLEKRAGFGKSVLSMKHRLTDIHSTGIIAEFKRKPPSKGIINDTVRVEDVTTGYTTAGVAGLSILTDWLFFGGSAVDLIAARETNQIPILRKDFMVDEYQVVEAKAMGADVILLIAAVLDLKQLKKLAMCAKSIGLEILLEIHSREEIVKIIDEVDMVGVNNRNLKDFTVDILQSIEMVKHIPDHFVKVSESGLDNVTIIRKLKNEGFQGFLIGEAFMKQPDPVAACQEFMKQLKYNGFEN